MTSEETPSPEWEAAFDQLIQEKRRALVSYITVIASIGSDIDRDDFEKMVDSVLPDLVQPVIGMGPAALNKACVDVILHLVRKLAEARGEPVEMAWQREAAELGREDGQRG